MGSALRAVRLLPLGVLLACAHPPPPSPPIEAPAELADLQGSHPAYYYQLAAELFKAGRKDDALFAFYLGQLRYRTLLLAHPDAPKDGDPAVFAALSERVGRPLNEYASDDVAAWARTIDAVLAYDRDHPDKFISPVEYPAQSEEVRKGLVAFRDKLLEDPERVQKIRRANGLENGN
jgi:hypothetical protein